MKNIANELRKGNWVEMVVHKAPNIYGTMDGKQIVYCETNPEMFEPIPLTEEWLVGFGFIKYSDCFYSINKSEGWFLSKQGDLTKSISEFFIRIEYVHQLQNLYYALTEKELVLAPNPEVK